MSKDRIFEVKINLENAAFEDRENEVSRILIDLSRRVLNLSDAFMLQDVNGNTCGIACFRKGKGEKK